MSPTSTLGAASTGSWVHLAVTRNGTTRYGFINGTLVVTTTGDSVNYLCDAINIGVRYSGTNYLNCYIDDLRITKGYARYTATFTPPTAAFPLQ